MLIRSSHNVTGISRTAALFDQVNGLLTLVQLVPAGHVDLGRAVEFDRLGDQSVEGQLGGAAKRDVVVGEVERAGSRGTLVNRRGRGIIGGGALPSGPAVEV